jgi:hypothetical protein
VTHTHTYTYRTDAIHDGLEVEAESVAAAVAAIIAAGRWEQLGSERETEDLRAGAWLMVFDADGMAIFGRRA